MSAPAPLLVGAADVARLLGVSLTTLKMLDRRGELGPRAVRLGRRRLWPLDELRRWVAAGAPPRAEWAGGAR